MKQSVNWSLRIGNDNTHDFDEPVAGAVGSFPGVKSKFGGLESKSLIPTSMKKRQLELEPDNEEDKPSAEIVAQRDFLVLDSQEPPIDNFPGDDDGLPTVEIVDSVEDIHLLKDEGHYTADLCPAEPQLLADGAYNFQSARIASPTVICEKARFASSGIGHQMCISNDESPPVTRHHHPANRPITRTLLSQATATIIDSDRLPEEYDEKQENTARKPRGGELIIIPNTPKGKIKMQPSLEQRRKDPTAFVFSPPPPKEHHGPVQITNTIKIPFNVPPLGSSGGGQRRHQQSASFGAYTANRKKKSEKIMKRAKTTGKTPRERSLKKQRRANPEGRTFADLSAINTHESFDKQGINTFKNAKKHKLQKDRRHHETTSSRGEINLAPNPLNPQNISMIKQLGENLSQLEGSFRFNQPPGAASSDSKSLVLQNRKRLASYGELKNLKIMREKRKNSKSPSYKCDCILIQEPLASLVPEPVEQSSIASNTIEPRCAFTSRRCSSQLNNKLESKELLLKIADIEDELSSLSRKKKSLKRKLSPLQKLRSQFSPGLKEPRDIPNLQNQKPTSSESKHEGSYSQSVQPTLTNQTIKINDLFRASQPSLLQSNRQSIELHPKVVAQLTASRPFPSHQPKLQLNQKFKNDPNFVAESPLKQAVTKTKAKTARAKNNNIAKVVCPSAAIRKPDSFEQSAAMKLKPNGLLQKLSKGRGLSSEESFTPTPSAVKNKQFPSEEFYPSKMFNTLQQSDFKAKENSMHSVPRFTSQKQALSPIKSVQKYPSELDFMMLQPSMQQKGVGQSSISSEKNQRSSGSLKQNHQDQFKKKGQLRKLSSQKSVLRPKFTPSENNDLPECDNLDLIANEQENCLLPQGPTIVGEAALLRNLSVVGKEMSSPNGSPRFTAEEDGSAMKVKVWKKTVRHGLPSLLTSSTALVSPREKKKAKSFVNVFPSSLS